MIEITGLLIFTHILVALLFLMVGYGMGKPKEPKVKSENKLAVLEPEGDLFNDLLKDEERVATIP